MSRLNQVISENSKAQNGIKAKEKRNIEIPVYDVTGKMVNPEKKLMKKRITLILLIIAGFLGFIYIPGIIINLLESTETDANYIVSVDSASIKRCNELLATSLSDDFDNDGIENDKEDIENINPWNSDTDSDGASDYYELYVSKTSPNTYDKSLAIDEQKKLDEQSGKSVSSPYKMGNVILWADDYESKALGGTIESVNGFHFNQFTGYAQFPYDKQIYAYGVKDGIRTLLPYSETENAWRIENYESVEIYQEPLDEVVELNLFFHPFYLSSNTFTKGIARLLPSKGFIAATKKTRMDVEPDTRKNITAPIVKPSYDIEDNSRFKMNTVSLSNLQYVRSMIDEGRCIAVSLYDMSDGEYIGIIYGYTYDGDLLIADAQSLKPIGTIEIEEVGRKMLVDEGSFVLHSYFDWKGLGFSSASYDRLSFFAVADATGTSLTPDMDINNGDSSNITNQITPENTTTNSSENSVLSTETTIEQTTTVTTEQTTEITTEQTTQTQEEPTTESASTKVPSTQAPKKNNPPSTQVPKKEPNLLDIPEID